MTISPVAVYFSKIGTAEKPMVFVEMYCMSGEYFINISKFQKIILFFHFVYHNHPYSSFIAI